MSDGSFISPRNPCHGRTYVEAETDRIVEHANDFITQTQAMAAKGVEGCDLLAHRIAAFRDGISAGLHR